MWVTTNDRRSFFSQKTQSKYFFKIYLVTHSRAGRPANILRSKQSRPVLKNIRNRPGLHINIP
jgi:hypothetical protein